MIYTNVTGRCGNQLFQYAFARKISLITGDKDLSFDFFNVKRWQDKTGDFSFDDQLKHFCVLPYTATFDNKDFFEGFASKKQMAAHKKDMFFCKVFKKLTGSYKKWQQVYEPRLNKLGIYCHENAATAPLYTKEKEKFIKGYFENRAYFDDIKEKLIEEFTPIYPEKEKNKALYDIIRSKNSVCVSFRRWSEVSEEVKKEREVCTKEYYEKAVKKIKELVPDAVFVVFSNDVEWVKDNFDFGDNPVYFEDGTDEIWEKLRMMYSCKHFIMATSTFTWWAQYLCRNENKIVVSPKSWYAGNKESFLIDKDFIKV